MFCIFIIVGTPIAMTGFFIVFLLISSLIVLKALPGFIPEVDICIVLFNLSIFVALKESITITKSTFNKLAIFFTKLVELIFVILSTFLYIL